MLNTYGSHKIIIEEMKINGKQIFRIAKEFKHYHRCAYLSILELKIILYAFKTGIMHKDYHIFIYYNYTTL